MEYEGGTGPATAIYKTSPLTADFYPLRGLCKGMRSVSRCQPLPVQYIQFYLHPSCWLFCGLQNGGVHISRSLHVCCACF